MKYNPDWSNKDCARLLELEEKNSFGPEPRLTPKEENELQELLDRNYHFVGLHEN
jgi:hypothetical protein